MPVEEAVTIEGDRQVLAAVAGNLLQNAFKFTRPRTTVTLRVVASAERVLIEIQDECGGLPAGNVNELFRPFEQRGTDRTGVGLGLAFSRWGVEANNGRIYARNLPERDASSRLICPGLRFVPLRSSSSLEAARMSEIRFRQVLTSRAVCGVCAVVHTPNRRPRVMLGAWSFDPSVAISNFVMRSRSGCDASSERYRNSA